MKIFKILCIAFALTILLDCYGQKNNYSNTKELKDQYYLIKSQLQQFLIKEKSFSEIPLNEKFYKDQYDLFFCDNAATHIGYSTDGKYDLVDDFAELSFIVIVLQNDLNKLGYPLSIYKSLLDNFEKEQITLRILEYKKGLISSLDRPSRNHLQLTRERIVSQLNSYRKQNNHNIKELIIDGGCGDGEIAIKIRTIPSGGKVYLIPIFFYRLCNVEGVNPDNTIFCPYWREPHADLLINVSGDYCYIVKWKDGSIKNGKVNFDKVEEGQVIIFRK